MQNHAWKPVVPDLSLVISHLSLNRMLTSQDQNWFLVRRQLTGNPSFVRAPACTRLAHCFIHVWTHNPHSHGVILDAIDLLLAIMPLIDLFKGVRDIRG